MATDKKINYAIQGGGPNYLGKQKMVKAPKKWKSSPTHPEAHLAYITDKEQDLLIKKNLYGSLKGKPNRGPSGIVSLQGDLGGYSGSGGGKGGAAGGQGGGGGNYKQSDYYKMMTGTGTTATSAGGDTYRSKKLAKMATPEWGYTPSGQRRYVGSQVKGKQGFISKLLGRGNVKGTRSLKFNAATGRYESEDEELGNIQPGFGGRILGGLAGLATGIPFVGPVIGGAIDKGKGIFSKKPRDMTQFNELSLTPYNERKISIQNDMPMESLTMANWGNPPEEEQTFNNQNFNMALPMGSAEGGRIGLYAGGDPEEPAEDIREIMRGQNIPYSEQVEGEEGILEQLIAQYIEAGFPPDQAEEMAMQELQAMSQGSEQGIASLV